MAESSSSNSLLSTQYMNQLKLNNNNYLQRRMQALPLFKSLGVCERISSDPPFEYITNDEGKDVPDPKYTE